MKILSTFGVLICCTSILSAQYVSGVYLPKGDYADYDSLATESPEARAALSITAEDMKRHLDIIASDEYGGRELGTEGNKKAGSYIAHQFARLELPRIGDDHSYYQDVAFSYTRWNDIDLEIDGNNYSHTKDFVSFPLNNRNLKGYTPDEIVFVGYGIEDERYSDYKKADVFGKTILIYPGEPLDKDGISQVTGTSETSDWDRNMDKKLKLAAEKGVELVLIIDDSLKSRVANNRRSLLRATMTLGGNPGCRNRQCHVHRHKRTRRLFGQEAQEIHKEPRKNEIQGQIQARQDSCKARSSAGQGGQSSSGKKCAWVY